MHEWLSPLSDLRSLGRMRELRLGFSCESTEDAATEIYNQPQPRVANLASVASVRFPSSDSLLRGKLPI